MTKKNLWTPHVLLSLLRIPNLWSISNNMVYPQMKSIIYVCMRLACEARKSENIYK